jgi:hypothetical protein
MKTINCVTIYARNDISIHFVDAEINFTVRGDLLFSKESKRLNSILGVSGINKKGNTNNNSKICIK